MPPDLNYDFSPYRLSLKRDPFTFAVYRDEELLLTSAPQRDAVTDWRLERNSVEIDFRSARLIITIQPRAIDCRWHSASQSLQCAFSIREAWWYGQGQLVHQLWPLNRLMLQAGELITADNGPTGLLGIQTPAWLSSNGVALLARSPVSVSFNRPPDSYPVHSWNLGTPPPFDQRPYADPGGVGDARLTLTGDDLHYEILLADDLPAVYQALIDRLGHPGALPPAGLFARPTWTTWARYKANISQAIVLRFAYEVIEHGYPYHALEIDARWQTQYGDLEFDPDRFPAPGAMIDQLHALGFKVTAWVMPFLDPQSAAFAEAAAKHYLVRHSSGEPYLGKWWDGHGSLLDVTNPDALDWLLTRLRALQASTGLDGFKFDAGEAIFLPEDAMWLGRAQGFAPTRNDYTHHYIDFVARNFTLTEVRSGWFNQSAPIFFRQWDKTSDWSFANGLRSVLTGLLSLSLTGYPFVLPDMIGGNTYHETPDAELMIRWTQLNALLPALQFSLAPWDFGEDCTRLCRRYAELHTDFAPEILRLAEETTRSGQPIVRPIFWLAPRDERALLCDDEFLLGNDILVAPVVQAGQRARDVYLPPGTWRTHEDNRTFDGPIVLKDYSAPLETLPIFQRLTPSP